MFNPMLSATVTFYDVVLFVHITAVVLAFGPTFAYPVFLAVAERTDPRSLPAVGRGIAAWDRVALILLVVIIAGGLYLVADGPWSLGDFYISFGFLAVIIIGGLSGAYFTPKTRRLVELAERDIAASEPGATRLSEEYQVLNRQVGKVGTLAGLLVIVTIYVMTAKPFL
jgi:hypothetical protein